MTESGAAVEIAELDPRRARDRRAFVDLPYRLARSWSSWRPGLRKLHADLIDPARNPFWRERSASWFVARTRGRVVGRMAVIDPGQIPELRRAATFAFPDFEDDAAVSRALFEAVSRRALERGGRALVGPMNPNIHHDVGIQVSGHERRNAVFMGYQPPYYRAHFEREGFAALADFEAWELYRDLFHASGTLQRLSERVERKTSLHIRPVDLGRFDRELRLFYELYSGAFADHWGFTAPSWEEFEFIAGDLRHLLRPWMTLIAEWDGAPVGFVLGVPDFYQILPERGSGRITPALALHMWRRWREIDEVRVMITGVLPAYRRHGLHLPLFHRVARQIFDAGFRGGEISWVLTANDPMAKALPLLGARRTKTYRLYQRDLHQ